VTAPNQASLRGALEGLGAGVALGLFVALAERSASFSHVYFDMLSPIHRELGKRLGESVLVRLDTNDVVASLTVSGIALAGAVLGAILRRGTTAALALALVAAAGYATIWRHRFLPLVPGFSLLGFAALLAVGVAALVHRVGSRRSARTIALALGASLLVIAAKPAVRIAQALRGPAHPSAARVSAAIVAPTQQKVALLALDGLDGRVLDEAFREGRLPRLRALVHSGVRADLRSIRPPRSPVVWTSAVTGALPRTHGILDFVVRRDGARIPVSSDMRRVPALWDIGLHCGFSTAFVNWYVTWPADTVRGVQVSDRADFDGLWKRVSPPALEAPVDSLRAALGSDARLDARRFTDWGDRYDAWRAGLWGQNHRAMKILDDVIRHDLFSLECARLALSGGQPDLVAVYFRGADNAQHLFWKHRMAMRDPRAFGILYPPIPADEAAALGPVIDRYYDFLDELTGELLAMLEPGTAILVASDHGFLANNERGRWWNVNPLLEAAGVSARDLEEPSIALRRRVRGDDLEAARAALAAARTNRGAPIVRAAAFAEDERGRYLEITFDRTARGDSIRVGNAALPIRAVTLPEGHSGDHRMDGVLIASGPPFRAGAKPAGARTIDLAPTLLHLVGAPVAEDMAGVVLGELLDPAWAAGHPVRAVESYGARGAAAAATPTPADERIREELEALGYIR
jgi:predicted AlkP superfamily phosphohydrolase/phosphomutase